MPTPFISVLTVCALLAVPGSSQLPQSAAREQWVNPGVRIPPPTNPSLFVKKIDGAFVGVLERVAPAFLDENDAGSLHTVLTFRVEEWLFGDDWQTTKPRVDVLEHGGTFVEEGGRRIPKRPAETAQLLIVGAEYFVPVQYGGRFGQALAGHLLMSSAAVSRLDGPDVVPVIRGVTWPLDVVAQVRAASPASTPPRSGRDVFLDAIRSAGRSPLKSSRLSP